MPSTTEQLPNDGSWSSKGEQSAYYSLRPGHRSLLDGELDGEAVQLEITVLEARETITVVSAEGIPLTVEAGVVEEREFKHGELHDVARLLVCQVNAEDRRLLFR